MSRLAYRKLERLLAPRLSPNGALGLHLTVGAVLLLAALALFVSLADAMGRQAGVAVLDLRLAHWLHGVAFEPLTACMLAISALHSVAGILLLTALLAWYFWHRQARYWLLALLLTVPAGMLLNVLLKHAFQRARPSFESPLVQLLTYSFPSGHTASATCLYGVLACYLFTVLPRGARRTAAVLAATATVILVAFSRLYLGAHYLTDVLAAMAEGVAWLAVCITAVSSWRRAREAP